MNDGGDAQTGQKAHEHIAGHLVQQRPQLVPRPALQGLSHQAHAKQEETQSTHHGKHVKNIDVYKRQK